MKISEWDPAAYICQTVTWRRDEKPILTLEDIIVSFKARCEEWRMGCVCEPLV